MALVADASAILALALNEEEARYGDAVIDAIVADEGFVPALFWFEIRNALLMSERRKRFTPERTDQFLADLEMLPIVVDPQPRWEATIGLARRHQLSVYDAAYLELAQRKAVSLATIDAALKRAAGSVSITVFQTTRRK